MKRTQMILVSVMLIVSVFTFPVFAEDEQTDDMTFEDLLDAIYDIQDQIGDLWKAINNIESTPDLQDLQYHIVEPSNITVVDNTGDGIGTKYPINTDYDMFLNIEDISGESTDDAHPDCIDVYSFNMGISQSALTAASSGGSSAERPEFQDFSIVKLVDRSTPKLAFACAAGTHIPEVTLELCWKGGDKLKFMEYKLSNVIVSSWSISSQEGRLPFEEVTFNYAQIEWTYTHPQEGNVDACWDLEKNSQC